MKSNKTKTIIIILCFFFLNLFWVTQDNRLPFIGDDARWLVETNNLTQFLKSGDFNGFGNRFGHLFMQDTNSVPRTPLFTLLSIPSFLVFGTSTDVAIITNLIVFAIASWLVYLLVCKIFNNEKQADLIGLLAVIVFNLFPGYFGMARLYMSEILQTAFVLLITLLTLKWGNSKTVWGYLILGILAGLGVLLRYILPIYLIVPALFFLYQQYKQKYKFKQIVLRLGLFLIGFVPVAATWYSNNFVAYWEFTRYTSNGALAEVVSLGPVWSPLTWFKYWKVIGLWHFSWPILLVTAGILGAGFIKLFSQKFKIKLLKKPSQAQWNMLYVALIPLPALLITTFSVNKTARYFLPVEIFWLILGVYIFWQVLQFLVVKVNKANLKWLAVAIMFMGAILAYPFMQSVLKPLPTLPGTSYLEATGKPLSVDPSLEMYEFVRATVNEKADASLPMYIIPEQVRLNDAEMQWYFVTNKTKINALGEFSPQHTYEEGKTKLATAQLLVIDFNPVMPEAYQDKYLQLLNYLTLNGGFDVLASKEFSNGAKLIVMKRQPIFALQY